MRGLKDKVAIVTGAGRGLGRATAVRLAEEGVHVLVNDVDARNAETTARMLVKLGVRASISNHDVADKTDAGAIVALAVKTLGGCDILINNAGIIRDALLDKMTEDEFDAVVRVNLKGVFLVTQAFARAVRAKQHRGVVVNIASISYLGNIGQSNYAAAKAGVLGMTRTWALELARHGIRVNAVAPGLMDTDMTKALPEKIRGKLEASVPLGRLGRAEELAAAVCFLASEDASYATGSVLHLDGGSSVGGF